LAGALGILVNGISQPFLGYAYDKIGGRKLIIAGIFAIGVTICLLSFTSNIIYFILIYGIIMSIAMSAGSITTAAALVSTWFHRKRSTAISISSSGGSLGALLLVPLATYLIIVFEWRITWAILGLLCLGLLLPLAFVFLKNTPSELGLLPDGDQAEPGTVSGITESQGPLIVSSWPQAFKSMPMWQLCGTYFVCGFTTLIMAFHFVPFVVESGFSPATAASVFGVLSLMNTVGVLAIGPLADKFGNKDLLALLYAFRGLGYIALLLLPGQYGLWAFALIAGSSWIATVPLTTSLTADVYGLRNVGTLSGLAFMSHQIGGSIGIQFGGIMRDLTGSYTIPFIIAVLLLGFASITSWAIQEKKFSTRYRFSRAASIPVKG